MSPSIATDYDIRVTAPLNAGSSELTIVARGDITLEAGGSARGRQVNLNALGRQDDPTTGRITDRIGGGTGSAPGTFAVQASELAVMVANDQIGSTSTAEGGRFNVDAPLFQLLKGSPDEAQIDPGFGAEDSSSDEVEAMFQAYSTDLGGLGLYSALGFTGGVNVPTIIPGLESTGLGELAFVDEGLFLLPEPYAAPDPATLVPPLQDPDFPGDLRPDDPDDGVAWTAFFDEVLSEYVAERYLLPEETDPERIARAKRSAEEELAGLIAFYETVRERERRSLAAQERALEKEQGLESGDQG